MGPSGATFAVFFISDRKTKIPVTMTLMGLGAFPYEETLSLDMLGMHGSVYANLAVDQADLLLAFGVRFDDRVTGKVSEFAKHGKIVHIDIDPSEINKNKEAHIPIVSDIKFALAELNKVVEPPEDLAIGIGRSPPGKRADPFHYDEKFPGILSQSAIQELWKLTRDRDAMISVGVGQHQMWAAQYYKFREPRTFLSSSGLGTMGFGLPAAMGAKVAHPDQAGRRHRRRRQLPDEHPGTGHLLLRENPGQGAAAEQPAPGHGRAVGRPLPCRQPGPHLSRPDRPSRGGRPGRRRWAPPSAIPTLSRLPRVLAAAPVS